jgi:hypothetical protein
VDTRKIDFEEPFACLTARSVWFVVGGGHALARRGRPRFTTNIPDTETLGPDEPS